MIGPEMSPFRLSRSRKVCLMEAWKLVLARNVKDLRKRLGLSQLALAALAGEAQKTVSRIERPGDDPDYSPRLEAVVKIAEKLGVTLAHLFIDDLDCEGAQGKQRSGPSYLVKVWVGVDAVGRAEIEACARREEGASADRRKLAELERKTQNRAHTRSRP